VELVPKLVAEDVDDPDPRDGHERHDDDVLEKEGRGVKDLEDLGLQSAADLCRLGALSAPYTHPVGGGGGHHLFSGNTVPTWYRVACTLPRFSTTGWPTGRAKGGCRLPINDSDDTAIGTGVIRSARGPQ